MTGVLLLHGFAGTRKELEPLKTHLEKYGFVVVIPLLKGHESTRLELSRVVLWKWI